MKSQTSTWLFILAFSLLTTATTFAEIRNIFVQQNCITEWSYQSAKTYENPFREVVLDAIITTPSGKELKVPAFWAGGNEWSFRYSSGELGDHTFRTVCNDTKNRALHHQTGKITVIKYDGTNPLFQHGPLKIASDRRNFMHADGTPFFWLADQWWHGMTTRFAWPEDFQVLTQDRKKKGFSVIGFAVGFPCDIAPFDPRGQNEAGDPWMDSTFTSINPAYFDLADLRINHLVSQGLVPSVMGTWGYYIKWAGVENMKAHYRYLVARYGAYPITWILAGEVTLAYYLDLDGEWEKYKAIFREQWSEVGQYLQENDPFDRLVTVHPGPGIWDGKPPLDDMDVLDFIFLQSGHSGYHTLPRAVSQVYDNLELYPDRPVLHGEVCFEGMQGSSGPDIQRFLFWSNVLSGTAGFSYGVEGIWQFNTEEQPFGASPQGSVWGNVPWETAYQYKGSEQVGIGKQIMEEFEYWRFRPHREWVRSKDPEDIFGPYCAGIPGEVRVIYMNRFPTGYNPYELVDLEPGKTYWYRYYDPITGERYPVKEFKAGRNGEWSIDGPPVKQDFVLAVFNDL